MSSANALALALASRSDASERADVLRALVRRRALAAAAVSQGELSRGLEDAGGHLHGPLQIRRVQLQHVGEQLVELLCPRGVVASGVAGSISACAK